MVLPLASVKLSSDGGKTRVFPVAAIGTTLSMAQDFRCIQESTTHELLNGLRSSPTNDDKKHGSSHEHES